MNHRTQWFTVATAFFLLLFQSLAHPQGPNISKSLIVVGSSQYPCSAAGINSAIKAVGGHGIVDARECVGSQTASETITIDAPVELSLGASNWTLNGSPGINLVAEGARVIGQGYGATILASNSESADLIAVNGTFQEIGQLSLRVNPGVSRTGGAEIHLSGSHGHLNAHDLTINGGYYGIWISSKSSGDFRHIQFNFMSGGTWGAFVQIGPSETCCIASSRFSDIVGEGGPQPPSIAGIVIDSGTDTMEFSNVDIGHIAGTSFTSLWLKDSVGNGHPPEWMRFANSSFEGDGENQTAVKITGCRACSFVNSSAGVSGRAINALVINGGMILGLDWDGGFITGGGRQAIVVAGVNGFRLRGAIVGDSSQSQPGNYCDMDIAGGVSNFQIVNNAFEHFGVNRAVPQRCSIRIGTGPGSRFVITGNLLLDGPGDPLINGATGSEIFIWGNPGSRVTVNGPR